MIDTFPELFKTWLLGVVIFLVIWGLFGFPTNVGVL